MVRVPNYQYLVHSRESRTKGTDSFRAAIFLSSGLPTSIGTGSCGKEDIWVAGTEGGKTP